MSAYVMHWHYKRGDLSLGTILLALFMGPILALIVKDNENEKKKHHHIEESENDRHMRWFRAMGEINRQSIPNYGRTIPPPPPISQNRRERLLSSEELEVEMRKYKLKNFKFFKG